MLHTAYPILVCLLLLDLYQRNLRLCLCAWCLQFLFGPCLSLLGVRENFEKRHRQNRSKPDSTCYSGLGPCFFSCFAKAIYMYVCLTFLVQVFNLCWGRGFLQKGSDPRFHPKCSTLRMAKRNTAKKNVEKVFGSESKLLTIMVCICRHSDCCAGFLNLHQVTLVPHLCGTFRALLIIMFFNLFHPPHLMKVNESLVSANFRVFCQKPCKKHGVKTMIPKSAGTTHAWAW